MMALVFYVVKRVVTKAFGDMPSYNPQPHPAQQNTPHQDIVETLWEGMSAGQLRQSFGSPQEIVRSGNSEVWVYANLNGQNTPTSVTLENGIVTYWHDANIDRKSVV